MCKVYEDTINIWFWSKETVTGTVDKIWQHIIHTSLEITLLTLLVKHGRSGQISRLLILYHFLHGCPNSGPIIPAAVTPLITHANNNSRKARFNPLLLCGVCELSVLLLTGGQYEFGLFGCCCLVFSPHDRHQHIRPMQQMVHVIFGDCKKKIPSPSCQWQMASFPQ